MSEQPGRYQRSFSGMIGAMLVLVLLIAAYVVFRAVFRDNAEVRPEAIDYLETVSLTQDSGLEVAYPPTLPEGWIATRFDLDPAADYTWELNFLTEDGAFAGVRQDPAPTSQLVEVYVDEEAVEGDPVTLDSEVADAWEVWTDEGGDTAYVAEAPPGRLMVFGSASAEELRALAESLTTAPVG